MQKNSETLRTNSSTFYRDIHNNFIKKKYLIVSLKYSKTNEYEKFRKTS